MRVRLKTSLKQRSYLIYTDNRKMHRYFWNSRIPSQSNEYDIGLPSKSYKNIVES